MLIQVISRPTIAYAIPPPIAVPTRPISRVSQTGMGSGPGTANRARAPVMNAVKSAEMTRLAMPWRVALGGAGDALARGRGRFELAEQTPRNRGNLVHRGRERGFVCLRGLAIAADLADELQGGGGRLFLV